MASYIRSIWDDDASADVRGKAEKGLAAWERARSSEDEATQRNELVDAYSHFRLAKRAAKRDNYAEILFYSNLCALMTGEISKWNKRLKAAKEAFKVAPRQETWLILLYGTVVEDVAEIELTPRRVSAQLWEDAHRHSDTSYGLALLSGIFMQRLHMPPAMKRQYKRLAKNIGEEIALKLQAIGAGESLTPEAIHMPIAVEILADAVAEAEVSRPFAVELYEGLAALPDHVWEQAEDDESGRSAAEHRDHAEARLEFSRPEGNWIMRLLFGTFDVLVAR
ncbi:MAG: hypothetical protein IIC91_14750 [Chloroflexi bacterium]|nr:hypothetical protein [Chloroflexota bacterium]